MILRELGPDETGLAFTAMRHLRPAVTGEPDFVRLVNEHQRPRGYRLVGSFEAAGHAVAVIGFRLAHSLAWGHHVYVDDLVTCPELRRRGHAVALLRWVRDEADALGCDSVHLDSAPTRHQAHRVYLGFGFEITALHFGLALERTGGTP